jgi:hypothetical protein
MEEVDVRQKDMSGTSQEFSDMKESFGREKTVYECYEQCMNDAWDMKSESVCASVCSI